MIDFLAGFPIQNESFAMIAIAAKIWQEVGFAENICDFLNKVWSWGKVAENGADLSPNNESSSGIIYDTGMIVNVAQK